MLWIILSVALTGVVCLIDYIVRRKTWSQNTKAEKAGLIMTFMFSYPFVFGSVAGTLLGKVDFGEKVLSPIIIGAGYAIPAVCIAGLLESIILRKQGRTTESNLAQTIAFAYVFIVMVCALIF